MPRMEAKRGEVEVQVHGTGRDVVDASRQATVLDVSCFKVCTRFVSRLILSRQKHGVITALRLTPRIGQFEFDRKG
jgi:hypothetical protein